MQGKPRSEALRPSRLGDRGMPEEDGVLAVVLRAGHVDFRHAAEGRRDGRFQPRDPPDPFPQLHACHGPDEKKREAGLRLDVRDTATALRDGHRAIAPGDPEQSELVRRVSSDDADERMPPPSTGKRLTAQEIDRLTRWIRQGAPTRRTGPTSSRSGRRVPQVGDRAWPKNDIDRFLLARLEKEKLRPSPEADRNALIRRLSLDLTGLPPTIAEVDQFVNDKSPDAYEKLVDRLLAREAFGEHWARMWLDLARYADSAGYVSDVPREIWAFRDYVIRSLNANKPFDQFTIEQIAGDLLPNPTEEQIIATAFHRNTQTNNEGGSDREEYRNVAIVDRVNTTMSVWMGTTMACAQCHDHKYDPITQKEYFQFFAFFNNTEDADREDEQPVHTFYTTAEEAAKLQAEIAVLEQQAGGGKKAARVAVASRKPTAGRQAIGGPQGPAGRHQAAYRADPARAAARQTPHDVHPVSRQFPRPRAASQRGRAGRVPSAAEGPAAEPPGAGQLARRRKQSADGPRARQPALGKDLRHRAGCHQRRFRHAGRSAVASRAAGLAGHRTGRLALGHQAYDPLDGHVGRLPAVVAGHAGTAGARSGQSPAGPRPAFPARCRGRPRPEPGRQRAFEREDVRPAGAAAAAVVRPFGGFRRRHGLANQRRRRPLSPGHLHELAADEPVPVDGHLRLAQPRGLRPAAAADEHPAAGPGDAERSGLRGSGPGPGAADRSRGRPTPADKVRYGFRLCLARPPSDAETARLVQLYEKIARAFRQAARGSPEAGHRAARPAPGRSRRRAIGRLDGGGQRAVEPR